MPTKNLRKTIDPQGAVGGDLRPAVGIGADIYHELRAALERMAKQTKREMIAVLRKTGYDGPKYGQDAADGSFQAKVRINALSKKWESIFGKLGQKLADRMVRRTLRHSAVTLGMSLRQISKDFEVNTGFIDARLKQVINASTQEAASLIRLIPSQYLGDVQGAVMRSITSGHGLKDLVPTLNRLYDGRLKHARMVALDQTRKANMNINAARLQKMGCETFVWIHSGGGMHPRKDHIALSGKEFRFDDPPVIGVMYGEEVRGLPAQMPNCRCVAKPVFNFGKDDAA
jgi:SPP1 gp7 family putative phage head morphogenesis protein